jgi:uncharacterized protein YdeI (YjbR/CyaY-like superfamily)
LGTRKTPKSQARDSVVEFKTQSEWDRWLAKHYESPEGVWLRLAKKGSEKKTPTYAEALETALCYGWIDAQKRGESDSAWIQRFVPRRPRSIWSKINREKALALIATGKMKPAGLKEVLRAQEDGRWEAAYDSPTSATVPPDFQKALDANRAARDFFRTLSATNRYAILWRLQTAKKPETRARRIETFIEMLQNGETFH